MTSSRAVEISRSDLGALETPSTASITDFKHLASYNWIEASLPTIAVPGVPALWAPPKGAQRVNKDSGLIYVAQNAVRHPDSPLEPLFRALYIEDPSFDIASVQVITDRNNIRKLLAFVNPSLAKNGREPFTIKIETIKDTAILCRQEAIIKEYIGPNEFRGFGHEFEKAYTNNYRSGSTGHHRVVSYSFDGMKFIVRHETDGYVSASPPTPVLHAKHTGGASHAELTSMLQSLSLSPSPPTSTKLVVLKEGAAVPRESTLEIKTRASHRPLNFSEVAPQLWASQTPKLVRAYHSKGMFQEPKVEDVTAEIKRWEQARQVDLRKLAALIRRLVKVTKECGGTATVTYDVQKDRLVVRSADGGKMLPRDLYSRWDRGEDFEGVKSRPDQNVNSGDNAQGVTGRGDAKVKVADEAASSSK